MLGWPLFNYSIVAMFRNQTRENLAIEGVTSYQLFHVTMFEVYPLQFQLEVKLISTSHP